MAVLAQFIFQCFDNNGDPLASGKVYSYEAGTSTPKSMYTTVAGTTATANPLILDSAGRGTVWLGTGAYDFDIKTSADVQVDFRDSVDLSGSGGGQSTVSFVDSIASVRALTGGITEYVYTGGYTSKGDLDPQMYYWSAASSASDDGYAVLRPNSAPATGRWLLLLSPANREFKTYSTDTTPFSIYLDKSRGTRASPSNVASADYLGNIEGRARVGGTEETSIATLKILMDSTTTGHWEISRAQFINNVLLGSAARGTDTQAYSTASGSPTTVSVLNKTRMIITPTAGSVQYIALSGGTDGQILFVFNNGTGSNDFYITNVAATTYGGATSHYCVVKGGAFFCYDLTLGFWLPGGGEQ